MLSALQHICVTHYLTILDSVPASSYQRQTLWLCVWSDDINRKTIAIYLLSGSTTKCRVFLSTKTSVNPVSSHSRFVINVRAVSPPGLNIPFTSILFLLLLVCRARDTSWEPIKNWSPAYCDVEENNCFYIYYCQIYYIKSTGYVRCYQYLDHSSNSSKNGFQNYIMWQIIEPYIQ